ncbi:hypothetical protein PRABACTJOHN_03697, partial [Parabacteroides johnsonii DSM 18315]
MGYKGFIALWRVIAARQSAALSISKAIKSPLSLGTFFNIETPYFPAPLFPILLPNNNKRLYY